MRHLSKTVLSIVFLLKGATLFAQKAVEAFGEFSMRIENNMTLNDARQLAVQYAQLKAIEDKFGKVVVQDNSTYIQNSQDNNGAKTNTVFNFISNTFVKGEWVEDTKPPVFQEISENNERWIKATVRGKIREVSEAQTKFVAQALGCPDIKCGTEKFNDGQDLYCYFKTPEDGYLSIYLTDPEYKYTFLLLPYKKSNLKMNVPVKADKDYVFFSKKFDYFNEASAIDEQVVSLGGNQSAQKYQLWFIFSPEPLSKPALEDETVTTKKFLDAESIRQGYTLQKGISEERFRMWLQDYRAHNKKIQLSQISIDVNKTR